jgi:acyl carrier protein
MNNPLSDQHTAIVNAVLVEELGVLPQQITGEAHLIHDLGADSLSMIEISMRLEERFNLAVSDEELEQVATVGDLYEAIAEALSKPACQ